MMFSIKDMAGVKNLIPSFLSTLQLVCITSFAQPKINFKPDQYRAINWTVDDSLPSNQSNTMYKDANGFLWIGSGAGNAHLCRFDGTYFKPYYSDNENRGAINSGTIYSFEEDSLHNIWIGTNSGLSRYDSRADTFTNFLPLSGSDAFKSIIAPFWATKDEVFCLEPGSLITACNIHTLERRTLVQLSGKDDPGRHWNSNKAFFEQNSNSIWTLFFDNEGGRRLQQIILDGRVQYYTWPCYQGKIMHGIHDHNAEDMEYDPKRNSVWINSGEGLIEFSLADKRFRHIDALDKLTDLKDYDRGVGIDIDKNGRIWLATYSKGIFIYDPVADRAQPLFTDAYQQQEVAKDNLHIYCDPDGITWKSDWGSGGLQEFLPSNSLVERYVASPMVNRSLSSGMITTIIAGPAGKLWIGTEDGLNIFDPSTETFEVLRAKELPGIKGKSIIPVFIDTLHQTALLNAGSQETFQKYFGMHMYAMNIKTRECNRIIFRDGRKIIDTFIVPHTLVRPYNGGVLFCDEEHGVFEIKQGSLVANLIIRLKSGFGAFTLIDDRYLFLQSGGSLPNHTYEKVNGNWTKVSHPLDSLNWTYFLNSEKDKTYWVSLADELIQYDTNFRKIKSYNKRNRYKGLILNMQFDNGGNLWFVTDLNKIGRLNPVTGVITAVSEKDGYKEQDYFWFAPMAKDIRGNLYFGIGWKTGLGKPDWGLDRIYPERYAAANHATVYLTSLSINQKQFLLSSGLNNLRELLLDYKQNTIRIETGIIDFYAKLRGHIRYRLSKNGKPGDWQYPPDNIVRYEDLQPGHYQLFIQAANSANEYTGPEKLIMIRINPPFWQTWWFRILATVAIVGFIYGFIQYRSHDLKKRNILLENRVQERTSELTKRTNQLNTSLAELKTTQDQLVHAEKMASLGELTSGIAHEIKNPLNFINNFSELNLDLINEIEEEQIPTLNEDKQSEVAPIIKTLKKNLEKINHHGKRVDEIVKSMLQHSRVGNLTKEPVNVNVLCEESLKLAYHGFKAKEKTFNASFETHFDHDLPNIMAIPQDLSRVLLNLFNNAFYAVHEKKRKGQMVLPDTPGEESSHRPMVTVGTKKRDHKVVITVSDNGTGIPSPIINKIFQPFFTTKPTGEGTGLGLSMSYDIITKSHGGDLLAKSKEGLGTDFEIVLPM